MGKFIAWIVVLCCAQACSAGPKMGRDAVEVANAFVQAYYVDTDIKQSLAYCEGLACETLKQELTLREGQAISGDTKRPHIQAELKKTLEAPEGAKRFVYEVVVKPEGIDAFHRKSYVKVALHAGKWRVTQFGEIKSTTEAGP